MKQKKEKIHWSKQAKKKEKLRLKEIIDTNLKFYSNEKRIKQFNLLFTELL